MPNDSVKLPILLDTCATIFLAARQLKATARELLETVDQEDIAVYVSPITAWEIGMLVSRGRLVLATSPELWFNAIIRGGVRLADISPEVLIASSFLPASTLRDPADRIVAATARTFGYRLMTRDAPLLDCGSRGHLNTIAC